MNMNFQSFCVHQRQPPIAVGAARRRRRRDDHGVPRIGRSERAHRGAARGLLRVAVPAAVAVRIDRWSAQSLRDGARMEAVATPTNATPKLAADGGSVGAGRVGGGAPSVVDVAVARRRQRPTPNEWPS